jgi:hypothetical protein
MGKAKSYKQLAKDLAVWKVAGQETVRHLQLEILQLKQELEEAKRCQNEEK